MKKPLFLLSIWLAPFVLNAQESSSPGWIFKLSPLVALHPYTPAIDIAVERRIAGNWYAELNLGRMVNLGYADNPVLSDVDGNRVQFGPRYYLSAPASRRYVHYFQLYGLLHDTDAYIEGDFCRFDCAFVQRLDYRRTERRRAVIAAYGGSLSFGKRWIFEFDAGLGYAQRVIRFGDIPPDASFNTNGSLIWHYGAGGDSEQIEPNVRLKLGIFIAGF